MYKCEQLAVIIPTRNRPEKVRTLLKSLVAQGQLPGRILIVASGDNIGAVVREFTGSLPVEYVFTETGGQIHQRNLGIAMLDDRTELVASMDDDVVLDPGAIESMIAFWNTVSADTAGVSFNITNVPSYRNSGLLRLAQMSSPRQGTVLRSGYNTACSPVEENIRTQWLCGGATVWKQSVLKQNTHSPVNSRWAICEDLIFSYPIGKNHPLYVCAAAKVRHEHVYDHAKKMKHFYYGYTTTLWRFYFEELHPELSRIAFFWMILCQILARLINGVFFLKGEPLQYAAGQIFALIRGGLVLLQNESLLTLLNEPLASSSSKKGERS